MRLVANLLGLTDVDSALARQRVEKPRHDRHRLAMYDRGRDGGGE